MRWRLVLPVIGFVLFAGVTYDSFTLNRPVHRNGQYFWWSFISLDSDPLNERHQDPCDGREGCVASWDSRWIEPGPLALLLVFSAFPAFFVGAIVFHELGRLGVSEVASFFVSMPLLISAWYYFIGWLVDRWRGRHRATPTALPAENT
jgi:hypothetical protein